MFAPAKRRKLIDENPFAETRHQAGDPSGRQHFIDQNTTIRLLHAAPDWTWRTIIALSRFGGLRCPSEVLSVRWSDVDWSRERLRVTSPKTEHHFGKASRVVPLFVELRPYVEEAWDAAEEGQKYVVPTKYRTAALGPAGWRNCNMRIQFERIIRRAGLEPWPRLFHNLRASRETELAEKHPVHVVTAWLGNTPQVALRHYLQVTEEDFAKAVQSVHEVVQNPVQSVSATIRQQTTEAQSKQGLRRKLAKDGECRHPPKVAAQGFEPRTRGL